jgi:hypothetical protein
MPREGFSRKFGRRGNTNSSLGECGERSGDISFIERDRVVAAAVLAAELLFRDWTLGVRRSTFS